MSSNFRIKDIAKKAGVSTGTVDRVLHNRGKVSEKALVKVKAVLNQIDYKPNLIARSLGSNKSYYIAAIVPIQDDDAYWDQSKAGIEEAGAEWRQYGVTIKIFLFDKLSGSSFIKHTLDALNDRPDAILIAPIFLHEARSFFKYWKDNNIPYVLFNTNMKEAHPLSFIGQNLYESGKVAGELMLLGQPEAKKVILLHMDEDITNSPHLTEKENGFRDYCKAFNPMLEVISLNIKHSQKSSIEETIGNLFSDPFIKGIFVSTSKETGLVASLLEKANRSDIVLIGYDLLDKNLAYLKKGTIRFLINQNPRRQASLGIGHLANHLLFKKNPPALNLFPLEIITRQNVESYLMSEIH
jgi:LacI family transcriptional regulator